MGTEAASKQTIEPGTQSGGKYEFGKIV